MLYYLKLYYLYSKIKFDFNIIYLKITFSKLHINYINFRHLINIQLSSNYSDKYLHCSKNAQFLNYRAIFPLLGNRIYSSKYCM